MRKQTKFWGLLSKIKLFNTSFDTRYIEYRDYGSSGNPDSYSDNENIYEEYGHDNIADSMNNATTQRDLLPMTVDVMSYNDDETTTTNTPFVRRHHPRLQELFDNLRERCIESHLSEPALNTDGAYCDRMVDGFGGCWPDTLPGEHAKIPCPDIPLFKLKEFAYRECTVNGTWFVNTTNGRRWANYTQCTHTEHISEEPTYIYIFIGGFFLSLVMLVISLGIFFRFRQLRCDRITIHKNLFLSYVLTGISWIMYYVLALLDGHVIAANPIWCQILHVLCQYFTVCNFLWMFCEGLYLNTIMVYAFNSGKILIFSCYAVGWGLPIIFTIIYVIMRSNDVNASVDCWMDETELQWIVYGPIVISIGVNVLFLINIVRLLISKLRQMPEADQTRKATRATLILVPLLGIQYILFPMRPEAGSDLDNVYHIAVAVLSSLQGAFVSLMYCFCNSEVIQVLRRKWNQHKLMHRTNSQRASATHGTTYTTMEPVTQTNTIYCSTEHKDSAIEMSKIDGEQ